jgi:hypothetical protein
VVVVFLVCPAVLAKLIGSDGATDILGRATHAQEKMIAVMHWNTCRIKYTAKSCDLYWAPRGMAKSAAAAARGKTDMPRRTGDLRLVYWINSAELDWISSARQT